MIWTRLASRAFSSEVETSSRQENESNGGRHGQRRAKKQSGNQETQEGEDQGDCRSTESEGRRLATDFGYRQEEIMFGARGGSGPRSVPRVAWSIGAC